MIIVDIEASGVNAWKNAILSLGAVELEHPKNQFYMECRLLEGAEVDLDSLKINGFTMKSIKDKKKPELKKLLEEFLKWSDGIEDKTLGGHNINFDISFINRSLYLFEMPSPFGRRAVDMHGLAYAHILSRGISPPLKDHKSDINSDFVHRYVGMKDEPKPHNGLTGAKMEAEAISRLIYGRNLLKDYARYRIPIYLQR